MLLRREALVSELAQPYNFVGSTHQMGVFSGLRSILYSIRLLRTLIWRVSGLGGGNVWITRHEEAYIDCSGSSYWQCWSWKTFVCDLDC
jgi:hypothetical protein